MQQMDCINHKSRSVMRREAEQREEPMQHNTSKALDALDCISRQDAIDAFDCTDELIVCGSANAQNVTNYINKVIGKIKALPSAQPSPQWIPCSERLPKNGQQVLVYAWNVHYALAKYDEMREADGTYKKQWVTFDAWKPFYTIKEVIAWMPLPEPYRGKKE